MAEDLDDGEFWLPSHFLTDHDILMDFTSSTTPSTSTSIDSDDDISLHLSSCPLHSKGNGGVIAGSPQSTLCRCVCNQQSSSRESVSPTKAPTPQDNTTLNLLNKAANEVARLKIRSQNNNKIGTGFFDCSQNRVSYPPPLHFQPHFLPFPPMVWAPSNGVEYKYKHQPKQQQNRGTTKTENKNNTNNNNNRPLGLPLSAWPPLQAQAQAQAQHKPSVQSQPEPQKVGPFFVGPPKGTGVFLPRRLPTNDTRNKSVGNGMKSKNGKGSQLQANNNNKRNNGKPLTTSDNEIQLPQEWTY